MVENEWLTATEVALYLKVKPRTVLKMGQRGAFQGIRCQARRDRSGADFRGTEVNECNRLGFFSQNLRIHLTRSSDLPLVGAWQSLVQASAGECSRVRTQSVHQSC